jgi:type IV pilus assembly protein PilF
MSMMRIPTVLLISVLLSGCSIQPDSDLNSLQGSNPLTYSSKMQQKLNFVQQYLALSSYHQAGRIFADFTNEERRYLSQKSIDYARLKGVYLSQSRQFKRAEKHYSDMRLTFPNDVVLLNNFGVLLLSIGVFDKACDLFEKAVLLSSQNSFSGLINLSRCELSAKKVDMARMYLKRAKEINNLPYIGLLTELNLALILGDLSWARQSYNKIQAEQKIAPYTEHRNEYECLLLQYNAVELDSTYYSSSRPPFACVVQGTEYGNWNSRKQ